MLDELRRNLVFALRQIRRSPGLSVTAVAILAVCIGANAATFSVVDAVLLRPLPYPEPDRLALVVTRLEGGGASGEQTAHDGATWEAVRDAVRTGSAGFDAAPFSPFATGVNFAGGGQVEGVDQQRVGAGFFRVLGVSPAAGRGFRVEEDVPGGPAVAVLSHRLAERSFGGAGAAAAVGESVLLRGEPHVVVGVMPPDFRTAVPADLWSPLRPSRDGEGSGTNYGIVARLAKETGWRRAGQEIRHAGAAALAERGFGPGAEAWLGMIPLREGLTAPLRQRLLLLWAAVALVLAIGCVNVAGLLLARGAARRQELATRLALGGGRGALVRQCLTESLVLAIAGGVAGLALAGLGGLAVREIVAESLGVWQAVRLDGRVLAFTAALCAGATVAFGLYPALEATRLGARRITHRGGHGVIGAHGRRSRSALVVVEVALGVVLLVGAGLLLRTLSHLQSLPPGFDPGGLVTGPVSLADARYATRERVEELFGRGLTRIRDLPGVKHAGAGLSLPFERALNMPFRLLGGGEAGERSITTLTWVTPGYLEALDLPLLRGRLLTDGDRAETGAVVLVNRAFVTEYLDAGERGGDDVLGTHLEIAGVPRRVVGVVGDVLQIPSWGDYGPLDSVPAAYLPLAQTSDDFLRLVHTWFSPSWVVRTAKSPATISALEDAVRTAAPEIPFTGFRPIERVRSGALTDERSAAIALTAFAAVALLLAVAGIGALIASAVTERTRELGVRLALGSSRSRAIRAVALPGLSLAACGVALGSLAALGAVRAVRHLVHGVASHDPVTFGAVAALLLAAAALASVIPALRIVRLDPARTLRQE